MHSILHGCKRSNLSSQAYFVSFPEGKRQGIKYHLFLDAEQNTENPDSKNGSGDLVIMTLRVRGRPFLNMVLMINE